MAFAPNLFDPVRKVAKKSKNIPVSRVSDAEEPDPEPEGGRVGN